MYYADRNTRLQYHSCAGNNIPSLAQKLPADSYQPLPPNPLLEMVAHGPSGHMGDPEGHTAKPNPVTKMSTMAPTQKPGPWPTTRKPWPTTGKPETGNDQVYLSNEIPWDFTRQEREGPGVYPPDYEADYPEFYSEVESQRGRKKYPQHSYGRQGYNQQDYDDYYDSDLSRNQGVGRDGRYPANSRSDHNNKGEGRVFNRNRNRVRGPQQSNRKQNNPYQPNNRNRNGGPRQSNRNRNGGLGGLQQSNRKQESSYKPDNTMFKEAYAVSLEKSQSTVDPPVLTPGQTTQARPPTKPHSKIDVSVV